MNIPLLARYWPAGTPMGQRRKNMFQRRNSPGQQLVGKLGGFMREGVQSSKLPNHLYHNYASFNGLFAWFCKRICKQFHKLQQYVCQSKMPLRPWSGWRCNDPQCQKLKSLNALNRIAFPLHIHHKNNLNVLSGLATYWGKLPWVHCRFEYNIGGPRLQAARYLLYSKSDSMAIDLELDHNHDCDSKAHLLIANNNPSLIMWYNINITSTNWVYCSFI